MPTTTAPRTVHQLAFDALFEKMELDPCLLSLVTLLIDDPHAELPAPRVARPDPHQPPCWANLASTDTLARAKTAANRTDVVLAAACTPHPGDDVHHTAAHLATTLGVTRGRALTYCDIGTMLSRMPATCLAVTDGAFSFDLLRILADATLAVSDDHIAAVDHDIAALLTPTRAHQCLPGPRVLRRGTARIIGRHQPDALAPDPDSADPLPPPVQPDFQIDTRSTTHSTFHISLPTDEATGVLRIIDAVATAHHLSRARALAELCHGAAGDVTVTLNCYRDLDSGEMHFENQWLTTVATDRWMARVTHLAVPSHSAHDARFATDSQKALRAGIDGTCRGPGCDHDAATAQTDHIHRYDSTAPDTTTDRTATWRMQQLCQSCHNSKTRGLDDYTTFPDGTTEVTSATDGHTVITVPTGPLAHADLTFDSRLRRRVATRAEHHAALTEWRRTTRQALYPDDSEVPF